MPERKTKRELFLELAQPDEKGFSRLVKVSEFVGPYERLRFGNGADWCRDDGGFAKKYNVRRVKERGRIIGVELHGYKKNPIKKQIRSDIKQHYRSQPCVVLATSGSTEVDHKDGRRDDPRLNNPATQEFDDFQPLSKAANDAKRQHCKKCRETDRRFDAKRLGYPISQVRGNGQYRGTCVGCYWYDPREFNALVSKG